MQHLKIYSKQEVLSLTKIRRFETKLGEILQVLINPAAIANSIAQSTAQYVLFGIAEDLGVKANYGTGGTDTVWTPFLQSFYNIQSNDFFDGGEILMVGHFDFGDLQYLIDTTAKGEDEKIEAYRHAVQTIDDEVEQLVKIITEHKKIPIAIGGGHNNAYPLLKGCLLYTSDAADEEL
jgi:formiminoglutamase